MTGSWDFFEGWLEGEPARVELDVLLAEEIPDPAKPWLLRVRIPIADADPAFVAAIATAVRARFEAVWIAKVATDHHQELVFHGTRHEGLKEAVQRIATQHGRRALVRSAHDSPWLHVRETILPNRFQDQWMQDRRVVEAMKQGGDRLEVPRPVDHTVYFRSVEARESFVSAVAEHGFEADAATDGDGHLRFGLLVRRRDPVVLDHIHAVVCELMEIAEEHGGQYDGWGAPLVLR